MNARSSRSERGTTLLLFPAAVLVLMILAAIAVDMSSVQLARRELFRTASQAADDGAAMVDQAALRRGDGVHIDRGAAERVVRFEMAAARLPGTLREVGVTVDDARGVVTVTATMDVRRVFGRVVPSSPSTDRVDVHVSGRLLDHR
ncbi:MAG: pilus assembly protein TadG-related protein [Acidimicrobiales bacterium]